MAQRATATSPRQQQKKPRTATTEQGGVKKPNRPPTKFESRLYDLCSRIPSGRITTYGAMAKALESSPRACGQALRRNPFAPQVPCHRVIAASLELGGFSGSWGINCATVQKKRALLEKEGVKFNAQGKLTTSASVVMDVDDLRKLIAS